MTVINLSRTLNLTIQRYPTFEEFYKDKANLATEFCALQNSDREVTSKNEVCVR